MRITFEIPDDLAPALMPPGQEPERAALEGLALEAYRERRLTDYQLRTLLGIPSRYQLDGFLKEHNVYDYTLEDFDLDLAGIREFRGLAARATLERETAAYFKALSAVAAAEEIEIENSVSAVALEVDFDQP